MDEEQKKYSTPIIHTLESDTFDMMQKEKDGGVTANTKPFVNSSIYLNGVSMAEQENIARIKKIRIMLATFMLVLLAILSTYLYFAFVKKPAPVTDIVNPPRIYKLVDVLPELNSRLSMYTNLATSTENSIVIDLVIFDNVYSFLIQNEKEFGQIVGQRFGLGNISEFTDINIQNNDVRIADGETGSIVYGYVEQKKLIITSSIEEWLRIKSNI